LPHIPQLAESVDVLMHRSTQKVVPPGHAQPPLTHVVPVGQTLAQAPQLLLSVAVLMQRPAQSVVPLGHWQRPAAHT